MNNAKFAKFLVEITGLCFFCSCSHQAHITGVITDGQGKPIPKAIVSVEGTQFQTTANDKGEYTVEFVPGMFKLNYSAPDFLTQSISFNIAQICTLPAAPVKMIGKPNVVQWQAYLAQQLLEQPVNEVGHFGEDDGRSGFNVGHYVTVKSVVVDGFVQKGQGQVESEVTATYQAIRNMNEVVSIITSGLKAPTAFDKLYQQGKMWKHHFYIILDFQPPNTWNWSNSRPSETGDEPVVINGLTTDKVRKLIVGCWKQSRGPNDYNIQFFESGRFTELWMGKQNWGKYVVEDNLITCQTDAGISSCFNIDKINDMEFHLMQGATYHKNNIQGTLMEGAQTSPVKTFESPDKMYSVALTNDTYLVLKKGESKIAELKSYGFIISTEWSPDGKYVAVNNRRANAGDYVWVIELPTGTVIKQPDDKIGERLFNEALDAIKKTRSDLDGKEIRKEYLTAKWKNELMDVFINMSFIQADGANYEGLYQPVTWVCESSTVSNLSPSPARTPSVIPSSGSSSTLSGERFPQTRMRVLTVQDLQQINVGDLRYAINEVYARYGADFKDTKIKQWFSLFPWYHPQPGLTYDDVDNKMTDIEKQNVKLLGDFRNQLGKKN